VAVVAPHIRPEQVELVAAVMVHLAAHKVARQTLAVAVAVSIHQVPEPAVQASLFY
jgi:hypothetical protein